MGARAVGVVVAGGASRRMGGPKARLPFGRGSLVEWAIALVQEATSEVWISCARAEEFLAPAGVAGLIIDELPGGGPLLALHSALRWLQRPVLFVACDLPFLAPADLRALARGSGSAAAVLLADAHGPQPIAARYEPSLLPAIEAALGAHEMAMHALIERVPHRVRVARPRCAGCPPLANINTPDDYGNAVRGAVASGLIDLSRIVP